MYTFTDGGHTRMSHARQLISQFYYIRTGQDYIWHLGIVYEYDFTLDSLSILKILKLDKVRSTSEQLMCICSKKEKRWLQASGVYFGCFFKKMSWHSRSNSFSLLSLWNRLDLLASFTLAEMNYKENNVLLMTKQSSLHHTPEPHRSLRTMWSSIINDMPIGDWTTVFQIVHWGLVFIYSSLMERNTWLSFERKQLVGKTWWLRSSQLLSLLVMCKINKMRKTYKNITPGIKLESRKSG